MSLIVYLDETGDHNMDNIPSDYPVFGIVMVIVDLETYVQQIVPAFCRMKIKFFGHEGVLFHSYDIRKKRKEFALLKASARQQDFITEINALMAMDYTLIAAFIRKDRHKAQYGAFAHNPYHLSLEFALERLIPLLEVHGQTQVQIVAESRGEREDKDFRQVFYRFANQGNNYIPSSRVKAIDFRLSFCPSPLIRSVCK